jgi:hypothetical protein
MIQDLAKCRQAELRLSGASSAARYGSQGRPRGRAAAQKGGRRRGRALLGRFLLEAGLHLLATSDRKLNLAREPGPGGRIAR